MPGEQRSKQLRMSVIGSACRSASRVPGTVIEEYGGKWSLAFGVEDLCAKLEIPALHDYRFRRTRRIGRLPTSPEPETQSHRQ